MVHTKELILLIGDKEVRIYELNKDLHEMNQQLEKVTAERDELLVKLNGVKDRVLKLVEPNQNNPDEPNRVN